MKKIYFCGWLCLISYLFTCTAVAQTPQPVSDDSRAWFAEVEDQVEEGNAIVYNVSRESYYEFIKAPSFEYLKGHTYGVNIFSRSELDSTVLVSKYISEDGIRIVEAEGGGFRMGDNTPIFTSFADFAIIGQPLNDILHANGIVGEVYQVTTICTVGLPIALWITVDDTEMFVILDSYIENENKAETVYQLSVYSQERYCEKILPKSGTLYVNDQVVTSENSLIMEYDSTKIPIKSVLQYLGALVVEVDQNTVYVLYNGQVYLFDFEKGLFVEKSTGDKVELSLYGENGASSSNGNNLEMDDFLAQRVFSMLGISFRVYNEDSVVRIYGDTYYGWICVCATLIVVWVLLMALVAVSRKKYPYVAKVIAISLIAQVLLLLLIVLATVLWIVFA